MKAKVILAHIYQGHQRPGNTSIKIAAVIYCQLHDRFDFNVGLGLSLSRQFIRQQEGDGK